MTSKNWFLILFFIFLTVVSRSEMQSGLRCNQFYSPELSLLARSRKTIEGHRPSWIYKFKPVYSSEKWNLHIISKSPFHNKYSPLRLQEDAINRVNSLIRSYEAYGFRFMSYLQILVEAHPNAMTVPEFGGTGIIYRNHSDGPAVIHLRHLIGVPNLVGFSKIFWGQFEKNGFEVTPVKLLLPAMSKTYHTLYNEMSVAHELAHVTENPKHQDPFWQEGRSDFLAFVMTGKTDVIYPEGAEMLIYNPDKTFSKKTITTLRSMRTPTVNRLDQIWPSFSARHVNSQIVSSVLFEISQQFGKNRAVEFIQWVDKIDNETVLPGLSPKKLKPKGTSVITTEFIDLDDVDAIAESTKRRLKNIGKLFRLWSEQSSLSYEEKKILLQIIENRQI